MSRFLFVVPPLAGHTNPTIAVGQALVDRGHEVAWCGDPAFLATLLPAETLVFAAPEHLPADVVAGIGNRSAGLRGAAALKFLWEDVLHPLAEAMVPGVEAAVNRFDPDVMICDQQAFAGALVARIRQRRWVTSATTSAEFVDPFAGLPKLREWVDATLVEFQLQHGVPPHSTDPDALRFSPLLTLGFTTEALVGATPGVSGRLALVGPAFTDRPNREPFPWEWLDDRPLILVSLGTVNAEVGGRFFAAAATALGDRPHLQGVLVAPPELVPDPPSNCLVRQRVPQVPLLGHASAVVSHGGHNTVCETLAHGIPLVVAPIRDDQPIIADQVERAGAGIRVRFARVHADGLGIAIDRVLGEPEFRTAAERIRTSFAEAGGARSAADHLEALL